MMSCPVIWGGRGGRGKNWRENLDRNLKSEIKNKDKPRRGV